MGAGYYHGRTSTVLHTDICSPIATDPTWSQLGAADRRVLLDDGRTLWHELLAALQPNVVLLSVAKSHLDSQTGPPHILVAQSDKAWPGHSVFSRAPALPSST